MTKKKTPTPFDKLPKKKSAAKTLQQVGEEAKGKWTQTGEIPGIGNVYDFGLPETTSNALLEALLKENKEMKERLNPQPIKASAMKPEPLPNLNSLLSQIDSNLSRLFNSINTLDSMSALLRPSNHTEMPIGNMPPAPSDIFSRMERILSDFNHLNNRLEATNAYLGEII
jgi:histone deacetylase complex regulatory component SIN3